VHAVRPTSDIFFYYLITLHKWWVHMVNFLIHSSMALQPFVGPWPLLQFRNHFYTVNRTHWTRDQPVARPLPTHRTAQTQNKRTMPWVGFEPTILAFERASEDSSCLRPRDHCDRHKLQYVISSNLMLLFPSKAEVSKWNLNWIYFLQCSTAFPIYLWSEHRRAEGFRAQKWNHRQDVAESRLSDKW
jgi:hypothetical protein